MCSIYPQLCIPECCSLCTHQNTKNLCVREGKKIFFGGGEGVGSYDSMIATRTTNSRAIVQLKLLFKKNHVMRSRLI